MRSGNKGISKEDSKGKAWIMSGDPSMTAEPWPGDDLIHTEAGPQALEMSSRRLK